MEEILEQLTTDVNNSLEHIAKAKLEEVNSTTNFDKVSYVDSYVIKGDEIVLTVAMQYSREYDTVGWRDTVIVRFPLLTVIAYHIKNMITLSIINGL